MLQQSHARVATNPHYAGREEVVVDPVTHGQHVFRQNGNTTCYQYTYDSRNDPRYLASGGMEPVCRAERVIHTRLQTPETVHHRRRHPPHDSRAAVVVEEVPESSPDTSMPTTEPHPRAHPHARSAHGRGAARPTVPIVEEPDDDNGDDDDDATGRVPRGAATRAGRQPQRLSPGPQPRPMDFGFRRMPDPFVEMERMHAQMMRALAAPGPAFGRRRASPSAMAGPGWPFASDEVVGGRTGLAEEALFPFGFAQRDPFADLFFGGQRMAMGPFL